MTKLRPCLLAALVTTLVGCAVDDFEPDPSSLPDVADAGPGAQDAARPDAGGETPTSPDASRNDGGTVPMVDAGANDAGTPDPGTIRTPAGSAELSNSFTANVTGQMQGRIGRVEMVDNVGTVEIDGVTWPAWGHERQAWPGFGLTLVQTLVLTDDALYPVWLYCTGDTFDGVYFEGTDGTAMTWTPATSGTCSITQTPSTATVAVPAFEIDFPASDHDFNITGELTVSAGQSGTFENQGTTWQVHGFEVVDCSIDCGTPGWWELHSILWDGTNACFSIFYLFEDRDPQVSYSLCLPGANDLVGDRSFPGTWTR